MNRVPATLAGVVAAGVALLALAANARAGTYYVYACSSYGNTAPAFTSWTDSDHMNAANECMQPSSTGGFRSLEINNQSGALIYQGKTAHWIANSPSPVITIIGAYTPPYAVLADCNLQSDGFSAQYFWGGGSTPISYLAGFGCNSQGYGYGTGINQSFAPSSYFGWGATCSSKATCSTSSGAGAVLGVQGVRLTVQENAEPGVLADGSNNLWYQGGHWVRGGGWPIGFTSSDPSGVCATDMGINGQFTSYDASNDTSPDTASFTQCWPTDVVTGTFDTNSYPNGPIQIEYAAGNAAGEAAVPQETLHIDNTPVTLSLSTPNDSDPNAWVNHAVQVLARASAGPSGLGGTACSTNNGPSFAYPAGGIALNGTGVWSVSCSSWNNAFDVNGNPASSPRQGVTVHIDETAPTIGFASVNPADPEEVVVDTSDGQSGVSGGQVEMRPATGGSWNSLATQFDGTHLLARFDDATLTPGQWVIQATSCDHVGNCATTDKTLSLPVRVGSVSSVGFERLKDPRRTSARCHRRDRRRKHPVCEKPQLVLIAQKRVRFGRPTRLHGFLTTAQGGPVAHAPIVILTAPDNGLSQYSESASTTTDSGGAWAVTLPAGPSRLIAAVYQGSDTIQPSQGWAKLLVPASVRVLRVWPRHVRWGGTVHIAARLLGGYLPSEGALVRLRLGYGRSKITYGVREHVSGNGVFTVTNRFGPGPASLRLRYWLQECSLPEGDYPFAPACGPRDAVTVGGLGG